tara:strand:- start:133 stop:612 length:480 start_codon:yes stop_codon:yes gene_type:complete
MIQNDERETWIALGYILGNVKFNVSITKASDRPAGYRVKPNVRWSQTPSLQAHSAVEGALSVAGLKVKDSYTTKDDIQRWVAFILMSDNSKMRLRPLFADQEGLHMFCWVYDNPPPNDFVGFTEWAVMYDEEIDSLSASLLKEESKRGSDKWGGLDSEF